MTLISALYGYLCCPDILPDILNTPLPAPTFYGQAQQADGAAILVIFGVYLLVKGITVVAQPRSDDNADYRAQGSLYLRY